MKRKTLVLMGIVMTAILVIAGIAIAEEVERNPATVIPSGRTVIVSDQATDNSPVLEKAVFIHYRKGFAKPCNNDGICDPDEGPWCADCKKAGGKDV